AGGYTLLGSTGAQRATQTLACCAAMLREPVAGGAVVEPGLRSCVEDRWREAYQRAGSGDLAALRDADPELIKQDSAVLGAALRAAARHRLRVRRALGLEALLGFAQPAATTLLGRKLRRQLVPARLPVELILGRVGRQCLLHDLARELLVVEVLVARRVGLHL